VNRRKLKGKVLERPIQEQRDVDKPVFRPGSKRSRSVVTVTLFPRGSYCK